MNVHVIIYKKVVWNRKGSLRIHPDETYARFSPIYNWRKGVEEVQADTLDNIISNLKIDSIDFLRMDIEGAEVEALEGAKRVLDISNKAVIATLHIRDGQTTSAKVGRILEKSGFRVQVSSDGFVYTMKLGGRVL